MKLSKTLIALMFAGLMTVSTAVWADCDKQSDKTADTVAPMVSDTDAKGAKPNHHADKESDKAAFPTSVNSQITDSIT